MIRMQLCGVNESMCANRDGKETQQARNLLADGFFYGNKVQRLDLHILGKNNFKCNILQLLSL